MYLIYHIKVASNINLTYKSGIQHQKVLELSLGLPQNAPLGDQMISISEIISVLI